MTKDKKNPEDRLKEEYFEIITENKKIEKKPWFFLIRKRKVTSLIISALLIFGLVTIADIPRELSPEVKIPIALVVTVYPGASPLDIEQQITKEIESQISDISGIKSIDSTSSLGFSSIVVEFEAGEDIKSSIEELKDRVDQAKSNLPADAEDPRVVEIRLDDRPIITITIASNEYDLAEIGKFADNIKDEIKGIPFVSEVVITGKRDKEIKIDVDPEKAAQFNLSINKIISIISANDINFPVGSLEVGDLKYNIRVKGEIENISKIKNLPLLEKNGQLVLLEDVATVREGFSNRSSISRLSLDSMKTKSAISIQVYKKTGGDITKLAQEVRKRIEISKGIAYPENVEVEITNDYSIFISNSLDILIRSGIQTIFLILIILFFFLGFREASLSALAIPFSFFIAFIAMSLSDQSLNSISLFSLVLSLGILVDSAIVVVEGMYSKVEKFGLSSYQAAISTINEYGTPLLSGTMTTVAAFFPLLFVKGIFGQFIKTIPEVVIITLLAGLFVAISIVPAIGAYIIKPVKKGEIKIGESEENGNDCGEVANNKKTNQLRLKEIGKLKLKLKEKMKSRPRRKRMASRMFSKVSTFYCQLISKTIITKKRRMILIIATFAAFIFSISLPFLGVLETRSFVEQDSDFFYINLEMPSGTKLERTNEVVQKIEEEVFKIEEVSNFVTNVGSSIGAQGKSQTEGDSNKAFIQVNLIPKEEREIESFVLVSNLRRELENKITEGKVEFLEVGAGPPTGKPIEARIIGEDFLEIEKATKLVVSELEKIPTVVDIETSLKPLSGELVFTPNKDILAQRGLSIIQVSTELRSGIARDTSLEISKDGEEIALSFGYDENKFYSPEHFKDLTVANQRGEIFFLGELGELKLQPAFSSIFHKNEKRAVSVLANSDGGNVRKINQEFQERIGQLSLPQGVRVEFGGETQELMEVYIDMLLKMVLGIIIILFILVLQFNSYRQTLIVLFTIPLALIGVFSGMSLARIALDIPAFIGIVSLSGIVVNNAIILIDRINKELEKQGKNKNLLLAVQNSGRTRLRPIFLTTITTVIGLIPLSISDPVWRSLGFSIIFGLVFSTFLTLILIPTLFVSFYKSKFSKESSN